METVGKNVGYKIEKNKMTIEIDLSKDFGPSKSGKTTIIASTGGNQKINGIVLGLNCYKK
jgi:hypothetical protein